jgi:hypothetical protein
MKRFFSPQFFLILMSLAIGLAHCSKTKEKLAQDFVIKAMTSGRWVVQVFKENGNDVTTEFAGYEFQFYENGTVQGINGSEVSNGTWIGNATAMTIYSNFPTANDTIKRLNDTWKIKNNTLTMVEANPTNSARIAYLKLVKK